MRRTERAGPADLPSWQRAEWTRRTTAIGYVLIAVVAGAVAAIGLTPIGNDWRPLLLVAPSVWISLRSLADAVDLAFDAAWDWDGSSGATRRPKWTDGAALTAGIVVGDVMRALCSVPERIPDPARAADGGIEVVEIIGDVERE